MDGPASEEDQHVGAQEFRQAFLGQRGLFAVHDDSLFFESAG